MPYHLEHSSGGHSFGGTAIVVNTKTGKHLSNHPIPLAKAERQKAIVEEKESSVPAGNPSDVVEAAAARVDAILNGEKKSKNALVSMVKVVNAAVRKVNKMVGSSVAIIPESEARKKQATDSLVDMIEETLDELKEVV